jgi:hypothetical protein
MPLAAPLPNLPCLTPLKVKLPRGFTSGEAEQTAHPLANGEKDRSAEVGPVIRPRGPSRSFGRLELEQVVTGQLAYRGCS